MKLNATPHENGNDRLLSVRLVAEDFSEESFLSSLAEAIGIRGTVTIETDDKTHLEEFEGKR